MIRGSALRSSWGMTARFLQQSTLVRRLFDAYLSEPELLPAEWRANAPAAHSPETARLVADYIAGMTDLYAFDAYRRLTGSTSP